MEVVFLVLMFVVGAVMGSFLCCQARRLRLYETKAKKLGERSVCLKCKYQLKWYDNLPIISWMLLRGRCRKCKTKIGMTEILAEVLMAIAFLMVGTTVDIYSASGMEWAIFGMTVLLLISLGFLAIYDGAYGELPNLCLTFSLICAIIVAILEHWSFFSGDFKDWGAILDMLGGIGILGGIYLLLYIVSRGKWVGDGDWILGLIIALALGSTWLALIALVVANFSAFLVNLPALKKSKNRKIFFGPFLVLAFVVTLTFGEILKSVVL